MLISLKPCKKLRRSLYLQSILVIIFLGMITPLKAAQIKGSVKLPDTHTVKPPPDLYNARGEVSIPPYPPKRAVIYVKNGTVLRPGDTPGIAPQLTQRNSHFHPRTLPVKIGTRVDFPNMDDHYHSVFSFSPVKRFDLGRYLKDETPPSVVFDHPGPVKVYCDIHDWMRATILVLETSLFTLTDKDGTYVLDNLAPGSYTLRVWLDGQVQRTRNLTIDHPDQSLEISFPLDANEQDRP